MEAKDTEQFKSLSIQHQTYDPQFISDHLISLLMTNDDTNILLANQLSFELCENSTEKLRSDIVN